MDETDDWAPHHIDIEKTSYTAEEFFEWHQNGRLLLSPDFQRGQVWKRPAKAFLIDTMLRGFPVPPIHIRHISSTGSGLKREVIDGQQRLTSVIAFMEGKFSLPNPKHPTEPLPPWAGKKFSKLEPYLQDRVRNYSFRCEVYKGQIDNKIIREIFSRINIYSVPLNDQEIRNGKYFGEFKNAVYKLAREHQEFWTSSGLFTNTALARMLDAQFVSEAIVLGIAGQQDKKGSLDSFYLKHEEDWEDQEVCSRRFREVIDAIRSSVGSQIDETAFRRLPLFYTLYAVVYHRLYGLEQHLPDDEEPLPESPKEPLSEEASLRLAQAMTFLSDVLSEEVEDASYAAFRRASARQTDNLRPRLTRFRSLWGAAQLDQK